MSVKENYEKPTEEKRGGVVEQWFDNLSQEDQEFIIETAQGGEKGWKTALWRASRKAGLQAGQTTFRTFLEGLSS